jgi:hypothetical protein
MWLVDSSVWIDYFNGVPNTQTELLDRALGVEELAIGDLMLCEVLQGFRRQAEFDQARAALQSLPVYTLGGVQIALQSAEHYCYLRQRGITVRKTIDCLIATFAINRGFALLHNARDFDAFEQHLGLTVVRE